MSSQWKVDDPLNQSKVNIHFQAWIRFIIRFRYWVILATALLVVGLFTRLGTLTFDNSNESFLPVNSPLISDMERFKASFGNEDTLVFAMPLDQTAPEQTLSALTQLTQDIETSIPFVRQATGIHNLEKMRSVGDGAIVIDAYLSGQESNTELLSKIDEISRDEMYKGLFVSSDGQYLGVLVQLHSYPVDEVEPRKSIAPAVKTLLENDAYRNLGIVAVGDPIFDAEMEQISNDETGKLWLIALALEMLIIAYFTRSVRLTWVPILVMAMANIAVFGLISFIGWKLTFFVTIVPSLIMCIGMADCIHIGCAYQDELACGKSKSDALISGSAKVALPCFLTTLTTAIGFLSFQGTEIIPLGQLGVYCAIGVFVALVFSYCLVPSLLSFGAKPISAMNRHKKDWIDISLDKLAESVIRAPKTWAIGFIATSIAMASGIAFVSLDTSPVENLSPKTQLRQKADFFDKHMGGAMTLDIVLSSNNDTPLLTVDTLSRVESLVAQVKTNEHVVTARSIVDIVKESNKVLLPEQGAMLPEQQGTLSDFLFLYEMGGGEMLDQFVSFDSKQLRIAIRTRAVSTEQSYQIIQQVESYVAKTFDAHIDATVTGPIVHIKETSDYLSKGQFDSFVWAFIAISLVLILVLKSWSLGVLSLLPNVLPILVSVGLMGWVDMPLSQSLIIFSPLILGVAVDDTIHFLSRFKVAFDQENNYAESIRYAITKAGRPLVFTTTILSTGFSVLTLSVINESVIFGYMSGVAFSWALLADLILLPALLLIFKPMKTENTVTSHNTVQVNR